MGIDQYAYVSPLRNIHPGEKLLLAMLTLIVVLVLDSILVSTIVFIIMSVLILWSGRVPYGVYLRLLIVPLLFLLVGCASIAVSFSSEPSSFIAALKVGAYWVGVSLPLLNSSLILFVRCLACVACMYFLALTTPITQIVYILKRTKLPPVLTEVMGLIYYAIFGFLATADEMTLAQKSRCGYNSFAAGMRSLSTLSFQMFVKFLHKSNQSYDALVSRGFSGSLQVLEESYIWKRKNVIIIISFNIMLVVIKNWGVV